MIATILAAGRALQHWKTFVRVACVVAIALGSISHVVADFASASMAPVSVVALQPDADDSCDSTVVERCHSCCVVSFLTVAAVTREEIAAGAVPDGRSLHLFSFRQPITAPPPRPLI